MTQIGNELEIASVKEQLNHLVEKGLIIEWEIPYEEILTRLTAAIVFLTPADDTKLVEIWDELRIHEGLRYRLNEEKKLSSLAWRVEFNEGFVS